MSWDSINTKVQAITASVNLLKDAADAATSSIDAMNSAAADVAATSTQLSSMVTNANAARDAVLGIGGVE